MKQFIYPLFLAMVLTTWQCKKDDNTQEPPPPAAKIDLSLFTATDITGVIIAIDTTDWTLDSAWTAEEQALFETPSAAQLEHTETADINMIPAFPNPLSANFYWLFYTSKVTLMQWVTVDSMLNVKERNYLTTAAGENKVAFQLHPAKYSDKTHCRFYYAFYSRANRAFARGHGDLRIVK
jgi:hypothetical protein